MGYPSHSYETPPAIWNHTVLPATRHRWTCPTLTRVTLTRGWYTDLPTPLTEKAEMISVVGCKMRSFTHLYNKHLTKLTTSWSQAQCPNQSKVKQCSHQTCSHPNQPHYNFTPVNYYSFLILPEYEAELTGAHIRLTPAQVFDLVILYVTVSSYWLRHKTKLSHSFIHEASKLVNVHRGGKKPAELSK